MQCDIVFAGRIEVMGVEVCAQMSPVLTSEIAIITWELAQLVVGHHCAELKDCTILVYLIPGYSLYLHIWGWGVGASRCTAWIDLAF